MTDSPHLLRQAVKGAMAFLLLSLLLDDDTTGYAYVAMPADRVVEFFKTFGGREVTWPDYATVLHQGIGDYPPEPVRAWFHDTYGMES